MDKTKRFFDESRDEYRNLPADERKFEDARCEFEEMTLDEKLAWNERVRRTHPKLERIVLTKNTGERE